MIIRITREFDTDYYNDLVNTEGTIDEQDKAIIDLIQEDIIEFMNGATWEIVRDE